MARQGSEPLQLLRGIDERLHSLEVSLSLSGKQER